MSRTTRVRRVAAKRYWCEDDARVVVDAWRAGGGTLAAFARRHGIDRQRLARWSARLGRAAARGVRFHPVRLAMVERRAEHGTGGIEISLGGGRTIRVERGFDPDDLRRVMALLEEVVAC